MLKRKRYYNLIIAVVLLVELGIVMFFNYRYALGNLDADNASEMVLSKLLANEKRFLSTNWLYSTELRVLNTQVVLSMLFQFFDDWRIVRTLGTGTLLSLMVMAYIYMVSMTGLGQKAKASACLLLLPFCSCYQQFVLFGLYYVPHVAIQFLGMGLFLSGINKRNGNAQKKSAGILQCVIGSILAFVAGLGGIRMLVVFYVPLFAGTILHCILTAYKNKCKINLENVKMALPTIIFSGMGFLVNAAVLSKIFTFKSFSGIEFCELNFFNRTDAVSNGILKFFGYEPGRRVMGIGAVSNLLSLILVILFIFVIIKLIRHFYALSERNQLILCMSAMNFVINMFTFYFADMWEDNGNYLIPFMIWMIPIFAIYVESMDESMDKSIKIWMREISVQKIISWFVLCTFLINGATVYSEWKDNQINAGKSNIVNFMLNNNYERGYADFWDANVFTEISNGKIDMCNIRAFDESFAPLEWLMDKRFLDWNEDSKVCIVVSKAYAWENHEKMSYLNWDYLVAINDYYCVFGFENDEELSRVIQAGMHR